MEKRSYPVIWTDQAKSDLRKTFLRLGSSTKIGVKFVEDALALAESLKTLPRAFQVEVSLSSQPNEIRRGIIINRYKLLYEITPNDEVIIFMVFDTKKDPEKLAKRFKKER